MPMITFVEADGRTRQAEIAAGYSLMQGALDNGVDAILAECGGCVTCATCHVYIDGQWLEKIESADDSEKAVIEYVVEPRINSRLSCQIEVTDAMDGLVVHLPESQY